MGLANEKRKLLQKLDEIEAFLFLTFQLVPKNKEGILFLKENYSKMKKAELRKVVGALDRSVIELSREFGLKVQKSELLKLYNERKPGQGSGNDEIFYSGKWEVKEYFKFPEKIFGDFWEELPSHALIGYIKEQTDEIRFEWVLPEAQTYMSMCASVNSLIDAIKENNMSAFVRRKIQSHIKDTVLQSYIFLEAYLNGIALDFAFESERVLSPEEKSLVYEWDFIKNRRRYLSTRDKVFKYIKLITGMDCPFSESNSDEMRFIFKDIEDFRDAIVHPNIFSFSGTAYKPKMNGHLRLCHEFALEAVDKTIKLIRIIDKMVAKDRKSRLFWMFDRTADGVFPEEAFL